MTGWARVQVSPWLTPLVLRRPDARPGSPPCLPREVRGPGAASLRLRGQRHRAGGRDRPAPHSTGARRYSTRQASSRGMSQLNVTARFVLEAWGGADCHS
jgi:hypothetical protein